MTQYMIVGRELHVAIPYSTTPVHWERLHKAVEY
ncbi:MULTISPECIES: hypothetical protein [Microvirgula]